IGAGRIGEELKVARRKARPRIGNLPSPRLGRKTRSVERTGRQIDQIVAGLEALARSHAPPYRDAARGKAVRGERHVEAVAVVEPGEVKHRLVGWVGRKGELRALVEARARRRSQPPKRSSTRPKAPKSATTAAPACAKTSPVTEPVVTTVPARSAKL